MAVRFEHDALLAGAAALEGADWPGARRAFETALACSDVPEGHEGLGLALWFLGDVAEGITQRELAFERYLEAGRGDDAARLAVWLSHQHMLAGRTSAARGWLSRAERSLEDVEGSCPGHGWVAVERARHAAGVQEQMAQARRALRIGRATGAVDLAVFALSLLGRTVVSAGHRDEGLRLLEEAMTAASSGRVRNVHTLAEAYCNLIEGCSAAGEWERGAQWCEVVEDFARTHHTAPLFGSCRAVHAGVLLATGQWRGAEDALEAALATHARHVPEMGAPAVVMLAELRVRQGRLLEAGRLLAGREDGWAWLRALALLRLAEGRPADAAGLLERALQEATDHPVRAAHLLAPLVDARLEVADPEGAAAAAAELRDIAGRAGIRLVVALADLATARVTVVAGRPADAAEPARRAFSAFRLLAMPFDSAQARVVLARACAGDEPVIAREQARSALAAFRELGAARAMDAAAALLRDLGAGTAPRPRAPGELTAREKEVLELVSLGTSNAGIAASLHISEKTAGHHVSRILAKLGVQNRTEAASYARTAVVRGVAVGDGHSSV